MLFIFILLTLLALLLFLGKKRSPPHFALTSIETIKAKKSIRFMLYYAIRPLYWLSFIMILISMGTSLKEYKDPSYHPESGNAFYFLIDQSGSMREPLTEDDTQTKIDLIKEKLESTIKDVPNDAISILSFARTTHMLAPLTKDTAFLIDTLQSIEPVTRIEDDGTAIGYAIFTTVNTIISTEYFAKRLMNKLQPAYTIKKNIIIVLTDGLQSPNPNDKNDRFRFISQQEAVQFAKEHNIEVFIVTINPLIKETISGSDLRSLEELTQSTRGNFFITSSKNAVSSVLKDIYTANKTPNPERNIKEDLTHPITLFAISLLLMGVLLETTFCRVAP